MYGNILRIVSDLLMAQHLLLQVESMRPENGDIPKDERYINELAQMTAHKEIIKTTKKLRTIVNSSQLEHFIAKYESILRTVYSNWEEIESSEGSWTLTNPEMENKARIHQIEELSSLLTGLLGFLTEEFEKTGFIARNDSLLELLSSSSRYVFEWLTGQPNAGEESITDWFLYNLSVNSRRIKYRKFNRHEEARVTGADMELWFIDGNRGICLRVQAKKLFEGKDNYNGIAYTNRHGLQIEKLIDDAKVKNAIPLYSFYYAVDCAPRSECKDKSRFDRKQGIHLASAHKLCDFYIIDGRKTARPEEIINYSNPLPCICCRNSLTDSRKITFLDEIYSNIKEHFSEAFATSDSDILGLHEFVPVYARSLIYTENVDTPQWSEDAYREELSEVCSLLVIDVSEDNNP